MITLKIINIGTDEVLNEVEVTSEEFGQINYMWTLQIELNKLKGIQSRLDVIEPEPE